MKTAATLITALTGVVVVTAPIGTRARAGWYQGGVGSSYKGGHYHTPLTGATTGAAKGNPMPTISRSPFWS